MTILRRAHLYLFLRRQVPLDKTVGDAQGYFQETMQTVQGKSGTPKQQALCSLRKTGQCAGGASGASLPFTGAILQCEHQRQPERRAAAYGEKPMRWLPDRRVAHSVISGPSTPSPCSKRE